MYHNVYRSRNRRGGSATDYLLPFLIILAVFIVLILLFNLVKSFFGGDKSEAAYMHIIEGDTEMRTWGTDEFLTLSSDALIMEGDEIATSAGSKVIIEFFDGTILRVNGGSDLAFEEIQSTGNGSSLGVVLVDGDIWVNKIYENEKTSELSVTVGSARVRSGNGTVFAVSSNGEIFVRGIQGNDVAVDIMDKDGNKVVETEDLGLGQEIVLNSKAFERYWQYQSPSIVAPVSDEFKTGDWYLWNKTEDQKPTKFEKSVNLVKVEPENVEPVVEEGAADGENAEVADATEKIDETAATNSFTPILVSVINQKTPNADGFFVVEARVATISGTVLNTAAKVSVNDYVLTKFKSGDTSWSYFANADFGFMKPGENVYEIYAYDAEGKKSGKLEVKILYNPRPDVVVPAETPAATDGGTNQ